MDTAYGNYVWGVPITSYTTNVQALFAGSEDSDHKADAQTNLGLQWSHYS